ncbi:MAG: carbonic anhydrase [Gammaproteobacteria bacterium]|nr:carbonic anhydrase [Gammaproteobacteria bacterium]
MRDAVSVLRRLRVGNQRFLADLRSEDNMIAADRRKSLLAGQEPLAIILGCSDSRVPAEIVFDQGLGDLFVIRVAGNIVAPSQIGSVEFAAALYNIKLVVVLGHSSCGAVAATVQALETPTHNPSPNIASIVGRIRPSVEGLMNTPLRHDHDALMAEAVRANVRASVNQLRHGSDIIERLIAHEDLLVVGAEYLLDTGEVQFFEGVPEGMVW